MYRNKRIVIVGSLLLAAAWAAWCVFFLAKGLTFEDVGFDCTEAWMLAQGELPFRDVASSAITLASWWSSWIFRIHPECSLLDLRIIWAIVMLLCALVTANIMLRYFNPWLSFIGAAASLFFVTGGAPEFRVLSYNTMPHLPLLLTIWMWLIACQRSGKTQVFFAAGAGTVAFLATTCRISVILIILLPILTTIYDRYCAIKTSRRQASIAFLASYLTGAVCFFLIVGAAGLTDDLLNRWMMITTIRRHGTYELSYNIISSSLFILAPGLVIALAAAFIKYRKTFISLLTKHRHAIKRSLAIAIPCVFFIVAMLWFYFYELSGGIYLRELTNYVTGHPKHLWRAWVPFLLITGVVLADVIFHTLGCRSNPKTGNEASATHNRSRLGVIAIFLSLLMILGSAALPAKSAWTSAWLLISLAVGIPWVWIAGWSKHLTKPNFALLLRGIAIAFLLLYPCLGIMKSFNPRGDRPIWQLSASPQTRLLQDIITTPRRAAEVDSITNAVEHHSEAGDRILVYYNNPMLYYLTHRLPSTSHLNLKVEVNKSRKSILQNMLAQDKTPRVVVYSSFERVPEWVRNDPIHKYVEDSYKVVQRIGKTRIMVPEE